MEQWGGGAGAYAIGTYPDWTVYLDATPNTGSYNVATGDNALHHNASGSRNIATGPEVLYRNSSGSDNIAQGHRALYNNTTGGRNIAIGLEALYSNTGATNNIALGYLSLYNTTGTSETGFRNIGIGEIAVYGNTTAVDNIGIGFETLYNNQTSHGNMAIGFRSLYNTTGAYNTAAGYSAGQTATTGSNNIYLGYNAQPASVTDSNQITLGDSNITHLRCQVTSITALSDARDKTGIEDSIYGLEFINKLRPVTFEWNMRDGGKVGQKDLGFLAQDIVELEDELNAHEILNLTLRSNPDKLEASYGRLVPILVKAVQDLSAEVQSLKQLLQSKD